MATKPIKQNSSRTQAQRRAETYKQVLDSACIRFGEQSYANTSLEEIANDCGMTTRPIYHYFANKKALFAAVNKLMEKRIIDTVYGNDNGNLLSHWQRFLTLCDDPHFRQIVLIDSPNVLGRERWATSAVTKKALQLFNQSDQSKSGHYRQQLFSRIIMASFAEAALVIAEAEDVTLAKQQADRMVRQLFGSIDFKT